MKMKPDDYEKLRAPMLKVLASDPSAWARYRDKGLSHQRFCWDVFWASRPEALLDRLYAYLNDNNITTALTKICTPYMT